uniref:Ig-like domain-containing protein n=1 Tax=Magallana gigas TaxID=29159 RepID=A0A8W8JGG0_MAGGI
MEAYILRSFVFFSIFFSCDLNLILSPRPYAVVKESRELELTCQSNRSGGVYWFSTVDDHGSSFELGTGGGDYKYCTIIQIDFFFSLQIVPVSTVTLSPLQSAVVDGKRINITCLTNDCRPPANITWFKGNSEITNQITSTKENRSTYLTRTISVLHYTGIGDDYGKEVYCRANNIEGKHVESNRYVINVTTIPIVRPEILLVECEDVSAKIFWTESSDHSSLNSSLPQTFLQISTENNAFVNCTYARIETNKSNFYIYEVINLKPNTKYRFKFMVSDGFKSDSMNIQTCFTDEEKVKSHKDENSMGPALGGAVGGALFLVLFVSVGVVTLYKRKQESRIKSTEVTSRAHYVEHPCPTTDQAYQEISSNQNTELQYKDYVDHLCPATDHPYQDVSNQIKDPENTLERIEYMELPDTILTNEESHYHTLK